MLNRTTHIAVEVSLLHWRGSNVLIIINDHYTCHTKN